MPPRPILLLGNPLLTQRCEPVRDGELAEAVALGRDLHDTMMAFRMRHGWGRAIAAPQIGILKRIVYLNVDAPWLLINPVITASSEEMITLWDDCMSFPDLLVRVMRHKSITVRWLDGKGRQQLRPLDGAFAELLQHEVDHLDGILSVARAVDGASFALQSQRGLLDGGFANDPRT